VSRFQARFISDAASRQLRSDPSQASFSLSTQVDNKSEEQNEPVWKLFEEIVSVCAGAFLSIDISSVRMFALICQSLENEELFKAVISEVSVSTSTVISRLSISITDSDVSFACEHFESLDHSELAHVPNVVSCLPSDSRLRIKSEDHLIEIVESILKKNESLTFVLDFVNAQLLTVEGIARFVSLLSHDSLSSSVW
jgi:hypothetical protein